MITTIILVIGVLFILNGIMSMDNSRIVQKVRSQMPSGCEIYFGGSKGLLFLSSTDTLIAVRGNGTIAKAYCVKSGWLRRSKSKELHLSGCRMEQVSDLTGELKSAEQKACSRACHQYMRRRK